MHVDGSGAGSSPWAFTVIWKAFFGRWWYGGHRVSLVALEPSHPEFVGACGGGSNEAELTDFMGSYARLAVPVPLCPYLL